MSTGAMVLINLALHQKMGHFGDYDRYPLEWR